MIIEENELHGFRVLISKGCSPEARDLQFSKLLAAKLSLSYDKLYIAMTLPLRSANAYLDREGLGPQAEDEAQITGNLAFSTTLDLRETSQFSWTTTSGESVSWTHPDVVDRLNLLSDFAARQSLDAASSLPVSTVDIERDAMVSTDTIPTSKRSVFAFIRGAGPSTSMNTSGPSDSGFVAAPRQAQAQTTPGEFTNGVLGEYFVSSDPVHRTESTEQRSMTDLQAP